MIQKPSLLQLAADEERQLQSQRTNSQRRPFQQCTCRALFKYKPYSQSRSYKNEKWSMLAGWSANSFSSTLTHHRDCMLSRESRKTKQFGFRMSFSGPLLRGALQAAMSMTRGSGGFSLSPALTFSYIVRSDTGPFKFFDKTLPIRQVSAADACAKFDFQRQELVRLYQQGNSSPSDVDEYGNNVLHVSLSYKNPYSLRTTLKLNQKACATFLYVQPSNDTDMSYVFRKYTQLLQDLYGFGIPLNNTNARGLYGT